MTRRVRFVRWLSHATSALLGVRAVPVGLPADGLTRPIWSSGTEIDKPWHELYQEVTDAREAWRQNPLAKRLISMVTAYVVGGGIQLRSSYAPLDRFIHDFVAVNNLDQVLDEWCDELSRAGELFPVLFTNPADGMSLVRLVPAQQIEAVEWQPGDYHVELRYRQAPLAGATEETWWLSPDHPDAVDRRVPIMRHYAVNRPVGAVRGESDLAPILTWLRRYSGWLEDRVRLNAGVRSFLWVIKAPARLRAELLERYRQPPAPGSVIIADQEETWSAVAPALHAADASADGRAIRWMIVAGGPGTALLDLGEGEDSNMATGQVMTEQRRRFLRRRQAFFGWLLADLVVCAYRRRVGLGTPAGRRTVSVADVQVVLSDISPEDNRELAAAARDLVQGMAGLAALVGNGETLRGVALRMVTKFAGEALSEEEVKAILEEGRDEREQPGVSGRRDERRP